MLQAWVHRGEAQRRVFVALDGAYHGDTFGAMSVGDPEPFFRALEPLLQGAAGMRVMVEQFVRGARAACDTHGAPLIADEVFTGFGRTGAMFACQRAGVAPDVMCVAKGITGGTLPLAATLVREELFAAFLHDQRSRFFPHGHTFTANPIACAVALASLDLCAENDTPARLRAIGDAIHERLLPLRALPQVADVRHLGGTAAVELRSPAGDAGYLSALGPRLRAASLQRGVLLRPLGDVLYALPPACVGEAEVELLATTMRELVEQVSR